MFYSIKSKEVNGILVHECYYDEVACSISILQYMILIQGTSRGGEDAYWGEGGQGLWRGIPLPSPDRRLKGQNKTKWVQKKTNLTEAGLCPLYYFLYLCIIVDF